jgi:drug/metabolite transporter (DMT)-like permease
MFAVIVALIGALVYGSADFLGGLAARRLTSLFATAAAAASGLVLLLVLAPIVGFEWVPSDLAWGALSGAFGVAALLLLYACLAIGPMSILSPLTAVVSAIAPMAWGLTVGGEMLGAFGYAGLGVAIVAVVLVGFVPEHGAVRPSLRGVAMAVGAGIAIGGLLICLDQTGDASGLTPLVTNRATNMIITLAIVAVVLMRRRGGQRTRGRRGWWLAVGCGLLDVTANALLLVALRLGDLSIVSALTALYPAGTIVLAAVVLRERIAPVQWVGLALALGAGALLAAA